MGTRPGTPRSARRARTPTRPGTRGRRRRAPSPRTTMVDAARPAVPAVPARPHPVARASRARTRSAIRPAAIQVRCAAARRARAIARAPCAPRTIAPSAVARARRAARSTCAAAVGAAWETSARPRARSARRRTAECAWPGAAAPAEARGNRAARKGARRPRRSAGGPSMRVHRSKEAAAEAAVRAGSARVAADPVSRVAPGRAARGRSRARRISASAPPIPASAPTGADHSTGEWSFSARGSRLRRRGGRRAFGRRRSTWRRTFLRWRIRPLRKHASRTLLPGPTRRERSPSPAKPTEQRQRDP